MDSELSQGSDKDLEQHVPQGILDLFKHFDEDLNLELVSEVKKQLSRRPDGDLELVSQVTQQLFQGPDGDLELVSQVTQQLFQGPDGDLELKSLISRLFSLVKSMGLISQPEPESEFMSLITQTISVFNSMDLDLQPKPLQELMSLLYGYSMNLNSCWRLKFQLKSFFRKLLKLEPEPELLSHMDLESQLISLISQLVYPDIQDRMWCMIYIDLKVVSVITQIISLVRSIDLNSLPKPESELMSLVTQTISVFNSMDLDSQPKQLQELISLIYQQISLASSTYSYSLWKVDPTTLFNKILDLEPELELTSLMHKVFTLVVSISSKSGKFISLCPQIQVESKGGKFYASEKGICRRTTAWIGICSSNIKWSCLPGNWFKYEFQEDAIHFLCEGCNGKNHKEYKQTPVEIKHYLHRKHSLQLVLLDEDSKTRKCYCCDEDLLMVFYYCLPCDFAMNVACVKKPPVLYIDHPKWHEHNLALFPRHASLTCNLCASADSSSPIYMCPPCDFVVHLRCINLPRVIKISRHHHRISFTPSFDQEDFCCRVCRRNIDNDYGGYSCIKDGCSYVAHSKCATQRNVWDGKELEGELEEEEDFEKIEPFVRISYGIIQHCSHQHHLLRLDENTGRDYDENKVCHACITPIYFGNFYSCMQCDFILHDECANLSLKIHHPIHPHQLTLAYGSVLGDRGFKVKCSACPECQIAGFFYKCSKEGCDFKLHVHCAITSEPLVHGSHMHPLFLTSKPEEEQRLCSVCNEKQSSYRLTNETFNCIECDFALCFGCATIPQKVRYKHDKHTLTLSYGKETSTTTYWCEVCESKIDQTKRFYVCDEYCCVTLHIECLIGQDLYMKPGSSWEGFEVLSNNHMTRPICSFCKKRCPHKIIVREYGSICCSRFCNSRLSKALTKRDVANLIKA